MQAESKIFALIFAFFSKQLAQCRRCKLVGRWRKCAGCRSTFYCGVDCQAADWTQHRQLCRPPKLNAKGVVAADLVSAAEQMSLGT